MAASVHAAVLDRPRERAEMPSPRMAKAVLRKAEMADLRPDIGRALDYARQDCHWSLKELAVALDRDPRQVARWIEGTESVPFHVVLACGELRAGFLFHLFRLVTPEVEVTQQITMRRTA